MWCVLPVTPGQVAKTPPKHWLSSQLSTWFSSVAQGSEICRQKVRKSTSFGRKSHSSIVSPKSVEISTCPYILKKPLASFLGHPFSKWCCVTANWFNIWSVNSVHIQYITVQCTLYTYTSEWRDSVCVYTDHPTSKDSDTFQLVGSWGVHVKEVASYKYFWVHPGLVHLLGGLLLLLHLLLPDYLSRMLLLLLLPSLAFCQYSPNWPSLDSRPLPAWYDGAKVSWLIMGQGCLKFITKPNMTCVYGCVLQFHFIM